MQVGETTVVEARFKVNLWKILAKVDDRVAQVSAALRVVTLSTRAVVMHLLGRTNSKVPHVLFAAALALF